MIELYLKYLESEKRYSPRTVSAYSTDLSKFFEYIEFDIQSENIAEVKQSEIREWVFDLMKKNLSPRSIHRKLSTLNGYFKYLLRENIIDLNPVSKIIAPKQNKRLPVFLEESRLNDFLDDSDDVEDSYNAVRDQTIIELLYATGIRRAELINIKIGEVSIDNIKVMGKGSKERLIPLTNHLTNWLCRFLIKRKEFFEIPQSDYLFLTDRGKQIYPNFVYRIIKGKLTTAGFTSKKSPHVLRHTFATHLLNNGADLNSIKTMLGHSSLAATQVYTHNTFDDLKRIHNRAHPRK